MTISAKIVNNGIKKLSNTNTLLDMLMKFEKVLAELDLYAFQNWLKGEVLEGPILQRYYVTVKLMYMLDEMPDPDGAHRLMKRGCLVKYEKDNLITPRKVNNFSDINIESRPDGSTKYRAKPKSDPVWVVTIDMPRRFVDEFQTDVVEVDDDSYVDTESMNAEDEIANDEQFGGFGDGDFGGGGGFGPEVGDGDFGPEADVGLGNQDLGAF